MGSFFCWPGVAWSREPGRRAPAEFRAKLCQKAPVLKALGGSAGDLRPIIRGNWLPAHPVGAIRL